MPIFFAVWSFGDPHIISLDNYAYTFNGLGEYTVINVRNGLFIMQGRTKQPSKELLIIYPYWY